MKRKIRLQRKLDRQRRANNPNIYNADGTINIENKEKWKKKSKIIFKNSIKTCKYTRKIMIKESNLIIFLE